MQKAWWKTLLHKNKGALSLLIPLRLSKPTREDLFAGITVAVVALPLAIALSLAAGAPASAGLYAAIFGGLFASLFGSSPLNISGPTGAMTVVLVGIVGEHGLVGMALAGLMAGIMQILLGLARGGRFVEFLPQSLVAGFITGIAVVIFRDQIPAFMGAPVVGLVTIAVMAAILFMWRNGPAALIGLAVGIVVNLFVGGPSVANVPLGVPLPSLPVPSASMLTSVFGAAVAISILGSIEGLLTASLVDSVKRTRHDSNRELVGQGVGNVMSAIMGGVPITGAVARTGVAVRSGGRTAWTGIIHSLILLSVVLVLAPLVHFIPIASLAGILMVTCFRMVEWHSLRSIAKAPLHYNAVLLVTLFLTIFTDLIVAVGVGFAVATVLFAYGMSRGPVQKANAGLPLDLESHATVYALSGPLFFAVTKPVLEELESVEKRILVLDMRRVSLIDASGVMMLQDLGRLIQSEQRGLIVWGLDPKLQKKRIRRALSRTERTYTVVTGADELEVAVREQLEALGEPAP